MKREDYESVGDEVYDMMNTVLKRLVEISDDEQWILPAKRESVQRLLSGVDAAWEAYWNELYGEREAGEADNGPTPADERGEVRHG